MHEGTNIRDLGQGDVVGEVAVLASGRRTASVVATSPVQALAFFKPDVWGPVCGRRWRPERRGRSASGPPLRAPKRTRIGQF
jgi:Cyclic nucleotide-binding domain